MRRSLVMVLLVGCSSAGKTPVSPTVHADAKPPPALERKMAHVVEIPPGSFCSSGMHVYLGLGDGDKQSVYDEGVCWGKRLAVGDTVPVDVGQLQARIVAIYEEGSNCGGAHFILEAIVDGRARRLHAGAHCWHSRASVGDVVTVNAILTAEPTTLPNRGAWLPDMGLVDGFATIITPANTFHEGW